MRIIILMTRIQSLEMSFTKAKVRSKVVGALVIQNLKVVNDQRTAGILREARINQKIKVKVKVVMKMLFHKKKKVDKVNSVKKSMKKT